MGNAQHSCKINTDEFERVIGYEELKEELRQTADVLRNPSRYAAMGVKPPHGLLLTGDPGIGKTLVSDCLIKASGRRTFTCRKDRSDGSFVDVIRKTFEDAKAAAPSIVFLDDLDKFANTDSNHRNAEEFVAVQSCIESAKGHDVFTLATVNDSAKLPCSLMRQGRFDKTIHMDNPSIDDATEIVSHYLEDKRVAADVDIAEIARILNGRSCAVLETAINQAGILACYNGNDEIDNLTLAKSCLCNIGVIPNTHCFTDPQWRDEMIDDCNVDRAFASWHEAGHAVVAELVRPGSVTFITNISNQGYVRGNTAVCESRKNAHIGDSDFDILMSLGGIAATDCRFGVQGPGTYSDRCKAFRAVVDALCHEGAAGFAYTNHFGGSGNSEQRHAAIEHAVNAELERYYAKAKSLIAQNRELLDKLALEIAQKGLLLASDVQRIKAECKITMPTVIW